MLDGLLSALRLTAMSGAMVCVFQEGRLRRLVGDLTVTGRIDATMPVLMFCIVFGLSMDYEMFLLSRIKEEYDKTGDHRHAVAAGPGTTGGLITAAAGLLALFFIAPAGVSLTHVRRLGLGTALAIRMDAVVIRGLLVPAFMGLAQRANRWAPDRCGACARGSARVTPSLRRARRTGGRHLAAVSDAAAAGPLPKHALRSVCCWIAAGPRQDSRRQAWSRAERSRSVSSAVRPSVIRCSTSRTSRS